MKVLIVGGTGLLGSAAAAELISRGHSVRALALSPAPQGASLPEMELVYGNVLEMTDERLDALLQDCDGLVYAAGVDERLKTSAPIYDAYVKYNIQPVKRLLKAARRTGTGHIAICGSYFSYFAKKDPSLAEHPYIKSRLEQEKAAFAFDDLNVAVLELPYIFGAQPGRKPVWTFLVEAVSKMKGMTFYPHGGTTMVTVRQVGQCIAGAIERNEGCRAYPIGCYNLTWREMLTIFHQTMGMPKRKTVYVPNFLFTASARAMVKNDAKNGFDSGLNPKTFHKIMCTCTYIDKSQGAELLGIQDDDIAAAISESVKESLRVINGGDALDMRGE